MTREIRKQAIEQPLHVLMAAASVWGIAGIAWLLSVPAVVAAILAGCGTAAWIAGREWAQWPSERWWDPPLDWFFEAVGIGVGLWSFVSVVT